MEGAGSGGRAGAGAGVGDTDTRPDVDIHLLGPVRIGAGPAADLVGPPKERLVLAALAVDAGRPVPRDTLIRRVWDEERPAKPYASLYPLVTRVRKRLEAAVPGARLDGHRHTYTLALAPERVDSHLYQTLTARARALVDTGDDTEALELFRRADALWRGEPLAGLTGAWAEAVRSLLTGKRRAAHTGRIAVRLRQGHFAEVVPELTALVGRYPAD
ncbi:winged helix-turn-helix domain-containing protein [Streptomyces yaizuensis]|uniref:Winged helix-turn-helix domain-containing protein n=1 Tax=Streptomyces yaizuensis TaxID=2989713 RepID=A0ABQ5P1V4_9ACTN|nr:winged helix-turn-helix domain-containing protein [Streptomyces sp. YSPA8]